MASILAVNFLQTKPTGYLIRLCKISKSHNIMQVALMQRLACKEIIPKPPPFPYWKKSCSPFRLLLDPTQLRFDDNSRLIVVDGCPALGKTKLCQKIAEEFGLLYMPPPILDEMYINPYGYDVRELDPKLPLTTRSYDLKQFLADPNHMLTSRMQFNYFIMRLEQYTNALLHLLATGQGVVLNGSIYSNIAYVYAMYNAGYLLDDELTDFKQMWGAALTHLLKPFLVVYLDASPEVVLQKIQQRGNPDEVNSKVFTTEYLSDLNKTSKEECLSQFRNHSEILLYNWNKGGNLVDIIDDIESLKLEADASEQKFSDWFFWETSDLHAKLYMYQSKQDIINNALYAGDPSLDCRYKMSPDDVDKMELVFQNSNEERYSYGSNPYYGDKVMFSRYQVLKQFLSIIRRSPRDFINFDLIQKSY